MCHKCNKYEKLRTFEAFPGLLQGSCILATLPYVRVELNVMADMRLLPSLPGYVKDHFPCITWHRHSVQLPCPDSHCHFGWWRNPQCD